MRPTPDSPATVSYREYRLVLPDIQEIVDTVAGAIAGVSFPSQWRQFGTMTKEDTAEYIKKAILTMYPVGRIGTIVPFVSAVTPQGMLLCDGSTYNTDDYPVLASAIDPVYVVSVSQFRVPDFRGLFLLGASVVYGLDDTGGEEEHTLTSGEMPSHSHDTLPHAHSESGASPFLGEVGAGVPFSYAVANPALTGTADVTILNSGGGSPHNNMPPFRVVKYGIIYQ